MTTAVRSNAMLLLLLPLFVQLAGAAQKPNMVALELDASGQADVERAAEGTNLTEVRGAVGGAGGERGARTMVNLEFFVMSKCPSARFWEQKWLPILQRMPASLNVRFTYIASARPGQEASCMHGPGECAGNRQRLCVQKHAKDVRQLMGFALCQGRDPGAIPYNGESCARSVGFDTNLLYSCSEGMEGGMLLQESAQRAEQQHVSASCTLHVQDEVFNGEYRNMEHCGRCYDNERCLALKVCCALPLWQRQEHADMCSGFGLPMA